MTVSNHPHSFGLAALIWSVGAVIWSIMRVFSSIVLSVVGYVSTVYDACHTIALRKTAEEIEVKHNLANYPDEIFVVLK